MLGVHAADAVRSKRAVPAARIVPGEECLVTKRGLCPVVASVASRLEAHQPLFLDHRDSFHCHPKHSSVQPKAESAPPGAAEGEAEPGPDEVRSPAPSG